MSDDHYHSVGKYYSDDRFTAREKLAIEFGERYAIDHLTIDDEFWARCREVFSDQEMLELTITAGFCVGMGRALQVLDLAVDFDVNWTREPTAQ